MTVTLTLGTVVFAGFEIPERLNFGGEQHVVKHQMVGGARQLDVMGSDPDDLSWSGRFRGASAVDRARQLDRMRIAGLPVTLTWDTFTYQVVITRFRASYERGGIEVPYEIVCTPSVGDVATSSASQTVDNLVSTDLSGVSGLLSGVSGIGSLLSGLANSVTTVSSIISTVGVLTGKSAGQTSGILTSLQSLQTGLQGAVQVANGHIFTGLAQIGGGLPTSPTGGLTGITAQIGALQSTYNLIVARGLTGRAINNVSQAGAST